MKLSTYDELTAVFQEMLVEFVPMMQTFRTDPESQTKGWTCWTMVKKEFEPKDPEARAARTLSQISYELIMNAVCPRFMADSTVAQGIEPCDICEVIIQMWLFDALYELDDNGEPIEPRVETEPAHWVPAFSVAFRPTNGWTPKMR